MPQWIGFLDKSGSPCVKLSIGGVFTNPPQEFDAVIYTGSSGFLSMPLIQAFPLGLPLFGTTGVVLADGSRSFKLTALGKAIIENESKVGVIILEPSSNEVLIGMDFLRTFGKVLILHPHKPFVVLEDCATVDAAMNLQSAQLAEPPDQQIHKFPQSKLQTLPVPGRRVLRSQGGTIHTTSSCAARLNDQGEER
ncbi:MAG: hypothetical protein ACREQA_05220 [Candidatus Binatia bacterium]